MFNVRIICANFSPTRAGGGGGGGGAVVNDILILPYCLLEREESNRVQATLETLPSCLGLPQTTILT